MRINNSNSTPQVSGAEQPPERRRPSDASKSEQTDAASLSALATKVAAPDEERIERLRKAVEDGSYKVDAAAVASRLIDESLKSPDPE
jgi:flagellar biosynthesis anti-sigma factor FlgM